MICNIHACFTHNNFFHTGGPRLLPLTLRFFLFSCNAAVGIAGGGRRDATAGRSAAAAAFAAADPLSATGLISVRGRNLGGD